VESTVSRSMESKRWHQRYYLDIKACSKERWARWDCWNYKHHEKIWWWL